MNTSLAVTAYRQLPALGQTLTTLPFELNHEARLAGPPVVASGRPRRLHCWAWLLVLLLLSTAALAQVPRLWQTTSTHPEGPKNGLAGLNDSTFVTAVGKGILRTSNQGRSWALALRARNVSTFYVTRAGLLLAGGVGKVYRSTDAGLSWDSATVATSYPVASFVETPTGGLLAGTGFTHPTDGYVGSGVFFSADQGQTWAARNNGLGAARYVNHLAADAQGRIFLSLVHDEVWPQPGLYMSADNGLSWQFLPIRMSRGSYNTVTAYYITLLAVAPQQDSLLLSFSGSGDNLIGLGINLRKSLVDVANPTIPWTVKPALYSSWWWLGTLLHGLHVARNGDWYSSCPGSVNTGGTLVSKDQGQTWTRINSGLGVDMYNQRGPQFFAETSTGKLLMVHQLDERVYQTNASVLTARHQAQAAQQLQLYPNPAAALVHVAVPVGQRISSLRLTDVSGRVVRCLTPAAPVANIDLDVSADKGGVYVVEVTLAHGQTWRRTLVKAE
jgi:photosystem II stability/assembly factor-like uncharacterized protein